MGKDEACSKCFPVTVGGWVEKMLASCREEVTLVLCAAGGKGHAAEREAGKEEDVMDVSLHVCA